MRTYDTMVRDAKKASTIRGTALEMLRQRLVVLRGEHPEVQHFCGVLALRHEGGRWSATSVIEVGSTDEGDGLLRTTVTEALAARRRGDVTLDGVDDVVGSFLLTGLHGDAGFVGTTSAAGVEVGSALPPDLAVGTQHGTIMVLQFVDGSTVLALISPEGYGVQLLASAPVGVRVPETGRVEEMDAVRIASTDILDGVGIDTELQRLTAVVTMPDADLSVVDGWEW